MPSDEQITIIVGWSIRGLFALLSLVVALLNSHRPVSRVPFLSALLLTGSLVGPLAEYTEINYSFARLTETAVLSVLVVGLLSLVFKADPVAWVSGTVLMVMSNVLYVTSQVTSNSDWEAASLVIGGSCAMGAILVTRWTHPQSGWGFVLVLGATALFYIGVILLAIFGPFVLAKWDVLAWTIVWEIMTTLYYVGLAAYAWFVYTPASAVTAVIPSDWIDWGSYVWQTGAWAPSRKEAAA